MSKPILNNISLHINFKIYIQTKVGKCSVDQEQTWVAFQNECNLQLYEKGFYCPSPLSILRTPFLITYCYLKFKL